MVAGAERPQESRFDTNCFKTNKPCPRKLDLVQLFAEHADPTIVPIDRKIEDEQLLIRVLTVTDVEQRLRGCDGETEDGKCPPGETMNDSSVRQVAARGFWKALKFRKGIS